MKYTIFSIFAALTLNFQSVSATDKVADAATPEAVVVVVAATPAPTPPPVPEVPHRGGGRR